MTKDKKIIYLTAFLILFALLFVLLSVTKDGNIITALLLALATPAVCGLIRKRCSISISRREVLLLSAVIAVLFVILTHMSGLLLGFSKNPYFLKPRILLTAALPAAIIIVTTEIIRHILLSQKDRVINAISFIMCVIAEILTTHTLPSISSYNKFMDLVGLMLFPAIITNIYLHYSSKRFGFLPNTAFRLITALYVYFIPTRANMSDALLACVKIFLPIIMLALISALYEKQNKKARNKTKKVSVFVTVLLGAVILSVAMLVSCQFRFGAIVIATESMTGEINKGDMIIYERYENQSIKEGQVIVFLQNGNKIIHRVVKIERIGDENRYYTKGDANDGLDLEYRVDSDIIGLTDIKLAYVGFPTLWLRGLLNGSK